MKLATFEAGGGRHVGAVDTSSQVVVEITGFDDMLELIEAGEAGLDRAREEERSGARTYQLAAVGLLAPLVPQSLRDCLVFEEHMKNAVAALSRMSGTPVNPIPPIWYRQPIYYKGNRFSVIGHQHDVRWPRYSRVMDYELELACVIGRGGSDIPRERALDHVFGYTIFNDASARDAQGMEMAGGLGPAKGKDFDTGNVLGPWIVTADEIGDAQSLTMVARVNGEEWSRGTSAAMHHRFDVIVSFISQSETLHPGDVIGSGTVGTGCGLEHGRFLSDGDVVELEVERIGTLRNRFLLQT
jgi:2-keto-4-pentenoate hydratase/2-oxohepta-3-ene-1,7-dioic acid hydratase in catechol pathway